MIKQRKIVMVVSKGSFAEAEERDNIFWSLKTEVERFKALIGLRKTFFNANQRIQKVAFKGSIYEKEAN
jgi:hypothetical protein